MSMPAHVRVAFDRMQEMFQRNYKTFIDVVPFMPTPFPPNNQWLALPRTVVVDGKEYPAIVPGGISVNHIAGVALHLSVNLKQPGIHASFSHPFMKLKERHCLGQLKIVTGRDFRRRMAVPTMLIGPAENAVLHFNYDFQEGSDERRQFDDSPRHILPD